MDRVYQQFFHLWFSGDKQDLSIFCCARWMFNHYYWIDYRVLLIFEWHMEGWFPHDASIPFWKIQLGFSFFSIYSGVGFLFPCSINIHIYLIAFAAFFEFSLLLCLLLLPSCHLFEFGDGFGLSSGGAYHVLLVFISSMFPTVPLVGDDGALRGVAARHKSTISLLMGLINEFNVLFDLSAIGVSGAMVDGTFEARALSPKSQLFWVDLPSWT